MSAADRALSARTHAEDRHLRLLLPRRPEARDLQGHDAAVHRAEHGALGDAARRARVHGPSPEGRTRRAGQHGDGRRLRARARRAAADGRLGRLPGVLRREGAAGRNGTATAIRDDYEIALLRAFIDAQQAGARRLPRRAGHQRRASAARCTRTSPRRSPARSTTATGTIYEAELPRDRRSCRAAGSRALYPGAHARQDQFGPPPGGQGARPRSRGRGVVGARPRRRGDALDGPSTCSPCSGIRSSTRRTMPRFIDDTPILDDFLAAVAQHKARYAL